MSLRNGVLPSRTMAVWSFAAVLLLAAGSLPLQAQEYTPLPGLRVSDGSVQYLFFSAGQCINLSNSSINGVVYTTHTSKWQRKDGATWVDVPGTERDGVCAYSTTNPGEYRLVAEISIGGQRGFYSSENTFTIEGMTPPPVTGGPTYYFPHLAVGQKWQTTIIYINYSSQEVTCTTDFLSDQGSPLMVSFADKGTVVSRTDVLYPGGSVHQQTNVGLSAPLAPGWARATCSGPLKASLLFRQHNSAGVPVAEAGVNAATVPATRFVTFAEQGEGKSGTGVAYANPSATSALVTFTAKDEAGQTLDSVVRTLLPGGHEAQNMVSLFGLSSFTGSLEVASTAPIVSLSLNFEAAPVFSSLPPGELDAAAQGSTTYYFPHLAVGASWQTTITYINYFPQEVSCQTEFLSDQGSPLMVSFADKGTVPSRTDVLLPGGSVHQETNVELNAPLASGWARATCSGPLKASLLFRQHNSEGMPIAEGGVNAATVPATRFVTFAEQGEGKSGTGVAYANPSATAAMLTFTARDADGETLASVVRTLLPGGHEAQNMVSLFGLSSFTGSLEVASTAPIVSLSLNFEAAPVFSSLPPGEAPAVTTPSVSVTYPADHGTIFISDQVQFLATVPSSGGGPQAAIDAVWESDAPAVATVSSSGLLTAVSAGEATISAEVTPGGRGSLHIRVFPKFHGHWEGNLNITRQTVSADWREFGDEECEGLDNCSSWFSLAADFTQDGAAVTGSVRTTFSAPPNFEWTVQGDVSIDGTLNLTFDEIALPIEAPIEVRATYISWKSRADAPGVMTGTAARQISSDALSGNILSEGCLGRAYKRRECSGWRSSDSPDPMFAPANEAAFNNLVVGKRISSGVPNYYSDFISPGRFRETAGTDIWTGSYTYRNTGSNTGTLTFNYDDGDRCTAQLTFTSVTTGTGSFTCNDGSSGAYNWRLVEIPASAGAPDLVIQTPSVSDSSPNEGGSFTLSATVRNQGNGLSASTTLRFYRSTDTTISSSDTEVGTDAVNALAAGGTSSSVLTLTAPSTAGTYYYGACVDPVSGESATGNNCSDSRAVTVRSGSNLQIYNDNVVVLPVTENLAAGLELPREDYAARFYEQFNDEFDFLVFVPNMARGEQEWDGAFYVSVKNDVQGIGQRIYSNNSSFGSAGKLQGVISFMGFFPPPEFIDNSCLRCSDIRNGTLLHEFMHRWGNFVVPITSYPGGPHWGFSSSGGYLDCYDISNMIDHGGGKFSAPNPFHSGQYSPIELYLAGFIPPEEVPDFQTAEDGKWLLDERGYIVEDDNGYRMFTASGFKTYTIEDIIAEHGSRVPDHSQAQKDFRAVVILLVSEDYPASQERLERLSDDVLWFSHAGKDEFRPTITNFYEATGGRGTITMDGLSQFQSRAGAKRLAAPSSFGTPPPPIVDLRE